MLRSKIKKPVNPAVEAEFARLRERVRPETAVPVPDVAQMVGREISRRERERAEQENASQLAAYKGGPCWSCGSTFSWIRVEVYAETGSAVYQDAPGWKSAGARTVCFVCNQDRRFGGVELSDTDWRGGVALDLLRAAGQARNWIAPAVGSRLAASGVALFWAEHNPKPKTHTSDGQIVDRYRFVDISTIVAALEPPPPRYDVGEACPQCGCRDRWLRTPAVEEAVRVAGHEAGDETRGTTLDRMVNISWGPGTQCDNCGHSVRSGDPAVPEGYFRSGMKTDVSWLPAAHGGDFYGVPTK
jgi:hypothetical protein